MSLNKLLGIPEPKEGVLEDWKPPTIGLFEFVKAIQTTKQRLIVDEWSEKQYNPYMVNRALSFAIDTIMYANEMNCHPHLRKSLQFWFLLNSVRPNKRFTKWVKAEKDEDVDLLKRYYGYNTQKAKQALRILSASQLDIIRHRLNVGGVT